MADDEELRRQDEELRRQIEQLRAELDECEAATRRAEADAGEVRGQLAEVKVQLGRAREAQEFAEAGRGPISQRLRAWTTAQLGAARHAAGGVQRRFGRGPT